MARGALHLFAAGMVAGALSGFLQRFIMDEPHLGLPQITNPLVMICATAAAKRQWQAPTAPGRRRQTSARPSSNLPYVAVAAVDTLLLVVLAEHRGLPSHHQRSQRHGLHRRENARLLARLDHTAVVDGRRTAARTAVSRLTARRGGSAERRQDGEVRTRGDDAGGRWSENDGVSSPAGGSAGR
ncbi:hypothetical protein AB0K00_09955 [Dactylosporangium sp. NPDC049525]|uniref:hypothetical protein n=1 Tax=Dactylosporangium sp. NPDC049525 TaxID=3154730 RepID=UPI00341F04D9